MSAFDTSSIVYGAGVQIRKSSVNAAPTYQTTYGPLRSYTEMKTFVRTPGYRLVRASAGKMRLKPLPYTHTSQVFNYLNGRMKSTTIGYDTTVYPAVGPFTYTSYEATGVSVSWAFAQPPSYQAALNALVNSSDRMAANKLRLAVKDQKVNLVQAFAERKQTTRLIGDAALKLNTAYRLLRRGQLSAAGRVFGITVGKRAATRYKQHHGSIKSNDDIDKMLSSGVLQIQYGIKPLISDIVGSYELMLDKQLLAVTETVRKSHSSEQVIKWRDTPYPGVSSTSDTNLDVSVQYGVTFAAGNEELHTASQVGLTNIALIAWELMPWSFVIDWFIPIGNAISSVDATQGLDFIDGWRSLRVKVNNTDVQTVSTEDSQGVVTQGYQLRRFERTVLTSFPGAAFPAFKNPIGVDHIINGVALLAGFKKSAYLR